MNFLKRGNGAGRNNQLDRSCEKMKKYYLQSKRRGISYEGCSFNSGDYLFTTETK